MRTGFALTTTGFPTVRRTRPTIDQRYHLVLVDTIYTEFQAALEQVIYTKPGQMADFLALLQGKLDERISNEPETRSVYDLL